MTLIERGQSPAKLIEAVKQDYPTASEVLVSFPDEWELIGRMGSGETPLYLAAMPPSFVFPDDDRFVGLPAEINLELVRYRHYKLFQPWQQPSLFVSWDAQAGSGRVEGVGQLTVRLEHIGQAQAWYGETSGVMWECYVHEAGRGEGWQEQVAAFWRAVEQDMGVQKIFTQPHEPTWPEGYTDFLTQLGYAPGPRYRGWWQVYRPEQLTKEP